jgi:hypothetical protein
MYNVPSMNPLSWEAAMKAKSPDYTVLDGDDVVNGSKQLELFLDNISTAIHDYHVGVPLSTGIPNEVAAPLPPNVASGSGVSAALQVAPDKKRIDEGDPRRFMKQVRYKHCECIYVLHKARVGGSTTWGGGWVGALRGEVDVCTVWGGGWVGYLRGEVGVCSTWGG